MWGPCWTLHCPFGTSAEVFLWRPLSHSWQKIRSEEQPRRPNFNQHHRQKWRRPSLAEFVSLTVRGGGEQLPEGSAGPPSTLVILCNTNRGRGLPVTGASRTGSSCRVDCLAAQAPPPNCPFPSSLRSPSRLQAPSSPLPAIPFVEVL